MTKRVEWAALLALVLVAAFLRLYKLDEIPPGWRDDELINSLVISQHVLDAEWAFFYPDASGHEALYHVLNAGMMAIFGPGLAGIRGLSVVMGVLSVLLTYLLGRQLFGRAVGLLASLGLSASFWSLMYSRVGLRHVSLLPCLLGAFYFWWKGVERSDSGRVAEVSTFSRYRDHLAAGLLLGLGFYTYFASRGVPFILLASAAYWLLFDRRQFWRRWRGVLISLLIAGALALPLYLSLARMPETAGRVEELAVPLLEAGRGNFKVLLTHISTTLSMFHADGDGEWLYNIPHRPVFNLLGAFLLLTGTLISFYRALPFTRGGRKEESVFLLLWLAAGLAPGFLSVPPASLGHTIIAQPVAYLLPAVALVGLGEGAPRRWRRWAPWAAGALAILFLASNAARDLDDYFSVWPERGMVRFLYRADIQDAADYLNDHGELDELAMGSSLAGPWDRQALLVDLDRPVVDRWFDPSRALLFPADGGNLVLTTFPQLADELLPFLEMATEPVADLGSLRVFSVQRPNLTGSILPGEPGENEVSFANGLALTHVEFLPAGLLLEWQAESAPLALPPWTLASNPPPPGVDTRPRLLVFVHLIDSTGSIVAGDDGLWVDPYTLQAGDAWLQFHRLPDLDGAYDLEIGLYDPVMDERVLLVNGRDRFLLRSLGR